MHNHFLVCLFLIFFMFGCCLPVINIFWFIFYVWFWLLNSRKSNCKWKWFMFVTCGNFYFSYLCVICFGLFFLLFYWIYELKVHKFSCWDSFLDDGVAAVYKINESKQRKSDYILCNLMFIKYNLWYYARMCLWDWNFVELEQN